MGNLFDPRWVSLWLDAAALAGLALWIFILDVTNRAQRVFAMLLALRSMQSMLGPLRAEAGSVQASVAWTSVAPYVILAVVPLTIYFVSLYPRRRGLAARRWGPWLLFAVAAGAIAWYVVDHTAYQQVQAGLPASPGTIGPLFLLNGLRTPLAAAVGLVLAREYRRDPHGSAGFSLFLLVAAFTIAGLFEGTWNTIEAVQDVQSGSPPELPWGWTYSLLPTLALPLALAACVQLLPVVRMARKDPELQEATRFMAVAAPIALATPLLSLLPVESAEDITTFALGVWALLLPFLIAYALMRHQLFDLDIRLKGAVRRGLIAGAFAVTFFFISEAATNLAQGDRGPLFGVVAAGALALASRPLKGVAAYAADRIMPDTKPIHQQTVGERLRFYLEQHQLIARDGTVSPKERRMLDRLRETLQLERADTDVMERTGALPALPAASRAVPVQPAGAQRGTRLEVALRGALAVGFVAFLFGMLTQALQLLAPNLSLLGPLAPLLANSTQAAGYLAALAAAFLLGPFENAAHRLAIRMQAGHDAEAEEETRRRQAFEAAVRTALEDGKVSTRERAHLKALQQSLQISATTRWAVERRARRALGL